nr:hypothetical protein [uncultured Anaerosporobacter sp.]
MKGQKFIDFENYLKNSGKDVLEFSFEQIENIIGQKLSPSAYHHGAYWYLSDTHTFPLVWQNAGYKMIKLDLREQRVFYEKIEGDIVNSKSTREINVSKLMVKRSAPLIDIEYVISKGNEFLKNLNIENSRYLSWEHCYTAFVQCKVAVGDKIDSLCLHLAFYLASWGMYRGSSFLLWKDYLVHRGAVIELLQAKYQVLRGINCKELLQDNNIELILELSDRLKAIYVEKRKNLDDYDGVSDILITKILMGTLGCVPAYDRFFVDTIRTYKIASGNFNRKSLYDLAEYYNNNRSALDVFQQQLSEQRQIEYPEMKILDMAFWYISYEKSQDKE